MVLHPRWTSHIRDQDRKKTFANTILNSRVISDRVRVILDEELALLTKTEGSDNYESPSWSHKQAHRNGHYRALALMRQLFDFDHEEPKLKGQTNAPRTV